MCECEREREKSRGRIVNKGRKGDVSGKRGEDDEGNGDGNEIVVMKM